MPRGSIGVIRQQGLFLAAWDLGNGSNAQTSQHDCMRIGLVRRSGAFHGKICRIPCDRIIELTWPRFQVRQPHVAGLPEARGSSAQGSGV